MYGNTGKENERAVKAKTDVKKLRKYFGKILYFLSIQFLNHSIIPVIWKVNTKYVSFEVELCGLNEMF
jgi:hypothetical protein